MHRNTKKTVAAFDTLGQAGGPGFEAVFAIAG